MDCTKLKEQIRKSGVFQWEIAKYLGISESTLIRKLRINVDPDFGDRVLEAVEILGEEKREKKLRGSPGFAVNK